MLEDQWGPAFRNEDHFRVMVFILQGKCTTQVHEQEDGDYLFVHHICKLSKINTVTSSKNEHTNLHVKSKNLFKCTDL
jgi:hypothetical protein